MVRVEDVLQYLRDHNINRINLDKIAFRMQDKRFFETIIGLLAKRHVYNHTLWSYGIKHDVVSATREYLQHANNFVAQCGWYIDSPLLVVDPVVRKTYEHMEYKPLVNARGSSTRAPSTYPSTTRFNGQYNRLLKVLSYRRELDG